MSARPLWVLGLVGVGLAAIAVSASTEALPDRPGKYFTWEDFTRSAAAKRIGDPNQPPPEARAAIRRLCATVLDPLCEALGQKVRITSGYRSPAVNRAVGGSPNSRHMRGEAADIKVEGLEAEQLAAVLLTLGLPIRELIVYTADRGGHTHIGA